ncbi:hypothetical protein OV203_32880 [Nannocystis sp. ILAH1]|uniref:hypothetical protein n=1 Tax=Nannocystis sp. ILAH1 TaxID=2996789 RepID=UPI002271F6F6|nr:hypothetical protein [Nannocystis sp. ILAH1]MCY0991979.1 hypothetical protein [Nannocystis sp. ILAH1]
MISPRTRTWGALGLAMVLGGQGIQGCSESWLDSLPEPVWDNPDYSFATDIEGPICGGTLDFQAGFVDRLQELFGQPRGGRRFTYYALSDDFFARRPCGDANGCYRDGILLDRFLLDLHELVHPVLNLAHGPARRFVGEGLAEVFRDRHGGVLPLSSEMGLQEAIAHDWDDSEELASLYARSGHFFAYVLAVHGLSAALDVYRSADPADSAEAFRAALEHATGFTMDELVADYEAYPECTNSEFRWPVMECSLAPSPWSGCAWQAHALIDCGLADVMGPRAGEMWTVRMLEIPADGDYHVTTFGDPAEWAYVEIGGCTVGCAPDKHWFVEQDRVEVVHLSAGPHYVSLVRSDDRPGLSGVRIEPADPEASGCAP